MNVLSLDANLLIAAAALFTATCEAVLIYWMLSQRRRLLGRSEKSKKAEACQILMAVCMVFVAIVIAVLTVLLVKENMDVFRPCVDCER